MSATSDLEDLLARQHGIQQNLLNLERQIYEYEGRCGITVERID
jgi:hypothetical protein